MEATLCTDRVLDIPEILHVIFSSLGAQYSHASELYENPPYFSFDFTFNIENQMTLARAAQCCQKFCSPALDALWRVMNSIVPLFSLVGLVKQPDDDIYTINTGFQSSQWARLESYASRIRHLNCTDAPSIQDFVVLRIAQHIRGKFLLRSLKSLQYPFTAYTILFLSPYLRHVKILANEEGSDIPDLPQGIDFIEALKSDVPLLQDFVTSVPWMPQQRIPTGLATFHHLHSLAINDTSSLDKSGLTHIFTLPSLIYLELQLGKSHTRFSPPAHPQHHKLRSLKMTGRSLVIGGILGLLADVPLHTIDIVYLASRVDAEKPLEGLWRTYIRQLVPFSNSLLWLRLEDATRDGIKAPIRSISVLQPLLRFSQLQTAVFFVHLYLDPDDNEYQLMAKSWPQINLLVLDFNLHRITQEPRATFATLEGFARCCPELRDLTLCIDVSQFPKITRIHSHPLRDIVIKTRIAGSHASVARRLDAFFPFLNSVLDPNVDDDDDDPQVKQRHLDWTQVGQIVQVCQEVRKDDKKRD